MSLKRIEISHFQSLRDVKLDLTKFTVIVGPSSSGKTALVRALKALITNGLTAGQISHGTKSSSVLVALDDSSVSATRAGASVTYRLVREGQDPQTFTKLSGAVPEAVEAVLGVGGQGLAPALCVASQFDRPYLLDESGAKIAQALGELTNVSVIFSAAKEANRRKLAVNQTLRTREADLAQLTQQAQIFKELPDRIAACTEAEAYVKKAQELESRCSRLQALIDSYEVSQAALEALPADIGVPDFGVVEKANDRVQRFKSLIETIGLMHKQVKKYSKAEEDALNEVRHLEEEFKKTLYELRRCPLCGQDTMKELTHVF